MKSKFYNLLRHATVAVFAVLGVSEASAQYCTPSWSSGCGIDNIRDFSTSGGITNISNLNTGCTGTPFNFYSTKIHTTVLNATVNFTFVNGADAEYYKIWVDFNGDQDYTDVGEEVYSSGTSKISGTNPVNGSFVVPPTAMPGTTRLRIMCDYSNSAFTPCVSSTWGEAEDYVFIISGTPCTPPSNPLASNITSKTATLSWTGVSGVLGYQYVLNTTQAPPITTPTNITGTTFNATGLTPSTTYWLHVRTQCNSTSISMWVDYSFTTLPPCQPPIGFKTTNLKPTSTTINWDAWPSAITYDYIVDQDRSDPGAATSVTNTALTNASITGLTEDTKYYVHIRSVCAGGELSNWSLDSFTTPVPCRAPVIKIDHINTTQAVAYWPDVPSAVRYEYVLTKSATPPSFGTKYDFTSLHTAALNDGDDYYIHVRCDCISQLIESTSPWGSANFKTFPTAVVNVNKNDALIEVYPNPVKDVLVIKTAGINHNDAAVAITDVTGKVVRTATITGEKTMVDMSGLTAGFYFVKYEEGDRKEMIKVMKQ